MRDYDQLRKHWLSELERSGELRALDGDSRKLLEEGSLDVFASVRLAELDRRRRMSRGLLLAGYLAFFVSLATAFAAHLLPAGVLLLVVVSMLLVGHRFGKGSEERQLLYEHLTRTRRWLDYALR